VKKVYWIIALLILTFVGDRLGGWILKGQLEKSQFRYTRMYTGQAQADILLVGNSRGLIFYEPHIEKITGKNTFNLSYNGMSIDLMNQLVHDYFEKYQAPAQMIVDVTMCDRINDEVTIGFNSYSIYSENLEDFIVERAGNMKSGEEASKYAISRYFPSLKGNMGHGTKVSHLFRYNSEIFQRAMFYRTKSDKDWLLDRVISKNMIDAAVELDTYYIDLEPDTLMRNYLPSHLKEMVSLAQSKGTDVQLVINPYYPPFAKSITNLESFKAKITAATGLKVHDYSSFVTETKGFGDYQHLNKYGAGLYLDQLKQDGILK